MSDRYLFNAFEGLGAGCDVMDGVEDFGAVITNTTGIADAYYDSFENDKALLVLEGLTSNSLGPNSAFAVLAPIAVRILFSALRGFHRQ